MSRWNIKTSTLIILSCVIFLMLLIVILPDVDLPDTAFHGGTAPVLVHARANMAPASVAVISLFQLAQSFEHSNRFHHSETTHAHSGGPNFLPILFHSLRC